MHNENQRHGATGQSGKKVIGLVNDAAHPTIPALHRSGADVLTDAGLANAMAGADVLV